jgi:hypothetical protein
MSPFPKSHNPDEPTLPDFDRVREGYVHIYHPKNGVLVGSLDLRHPNPNDAMSNMDAADEYQRSGYIVW